MASVPHRVDAVDARRVTDAGYERHAIGPAGESHHRREGLTDGFASVERVAVGQQIVDVGLR